ncbi:MAG: FkbM family methyltransferase [Verrucomicrobiota bacterium]|nr:FkbM family methyltransferase [Verrucomicrobiota bacterium]
MFFPLLLAFFFNHQLLDPSLTRPEEISYLEAFPQEEYQIYSVTGLGSFYLDNKSDTIKDILKRNLQWDTTAIALIQRYAKPGTVVIDVGAHIGTLTLCLSKAVGPQGQVLAFEPQPKIFRELIMNLTLNESNNVIARHCALGEKKKKIHLDPVLPDNEGARTIGKGSETARMFRLDDFPLNNVSFIKIDAENYESYILDGAKKTISRNKPVILIEIMGHKLKAAQERVDADQKRKETIKKLKKLGYKVEFIGYDDYLATPQ